TNIIEDLNNDVGIEIQNFITNLRFITLFGDGWTSQTRNSIVNYVLVNEKRQKVGMEIEIERWVGFVTDS
ncbi:15699_t:CDS:2, partial [Funneliformis mosseae]